MDEELQKMIRYELNYIYCVLMDHAILCGDSTDVFSCEFLKAHNETATRILAQEDRENEKHK